MSEPTTPAEAIEQAALGPKSVTVKDETTIARDIDELIAADNHLAARSARTRKGFGLRFQKIVPPGGG